MTKMNLLKKINILGNILIFTLSNIFSIKTSPGDYCESVIPDPIPNSAVKPFSANGTLS